MTDYNKYVDVFLGCDDIDLPEPEGIAAAWHFIKGLCGNTHPGATLPFGRMSCCCYSGGYSAGYGNNRVNCGGKISKLYDGNKCRGFSHLHLSGIGFIGKFYNYAVTSPFYGELSGAFLPRDMKNEHAKLGLYGTTVICAEGEVECNVTVTEYNALHRYRFGRDGGRIAVDFSNDGLYRESSNAYGLSERSELCRVSDSEACAAVVMQGIRLYIYVRCSVSGKCKLWRENGTDCGDTLVLPRTEERFGAVFDISDEKADITLSVSAKSMEHARGCVLGEALSFDEAAAAAYGRWNAALGKIEIEADERTKRLFYSNLYHSFIKPSDRSGEGLFGSEGGFAVDYNTLWDQYKTHLPLVFTFFSEMRKKTLETFLAVERYAGLLPHNLMLDANVNIEVQQARALAQHVIADAYFRAAECGGDIDSIPSGELIAAAVRDIYREDYKDFTENGCCSRATHQLDMA
jgi:putative alpha-1,2-mannosidase